MALYSFAPAGTANAICSNTSQTIAIQAGAVVISNLGNTPAYVALASSVTVSTGIVVKPYSTITLTSTGTQLSVIGQGAVLSITWGSVSGGKSFIIKTVFDEGIAMSLLTGTAPAINTPGNLWQTWPTVNSLFYNTGGGAAGGLGINRGNTLETNAPINGVLTFSGLTNTSVNLVVFRYSGNGDDYLSVWFLGSNTVALREAVNGTTSTIQSITVPDGTAGDVVVTLNGASVSVVAFGQTMTYTIPSGHATLTGSMLGFFSTSTWVVGGVSLI